MLSELFDTIMQRSLSLRRAWIEIYRITYGGTIYECRSPYGERGLKYNVLCLCAVYAMSLSLRRAWIEIFIVSRRVKPLLGRSPYGERGLKCFRPHIRGMVWGGRSPYGERGLKFVAIGQDVRLSQSLSLRRAWIEIRLTWDDASPTMSLSLRRAWIEILANTPAHT